MSSEMGLLRPAGSSNSTPCSIRKAYAALSGDLAAISLGGDNLQVFVNGAFPD